MVKTGRVYPRVTTMHFRIISIYIGILIFKYVATDHLTESSQHERETFHNCPEQKIRCAVIF